MELYLSLIIFTSILQILDSPCYTQNVTAQRWFLKNSKVYLSFIYWNQIKMGERPKADPFETYMHTEIDKLRSRNE